MHVNDWQYLIEKYLNNTISEDEYGILLGKLASQESEDELSDSLKSIWVKQVIHKSKVDWENRFEMMMEETKVHSPKTKSGNSVKIRVLIRSLAVAASVFVLLVGYRFYQDSVIKQKSLSHIEFSIPAPKGSKAIMILSDGKTLSLDRTLNGKIAKEGNVNVVTNSEGEIFYKANNENALGQVKYNTLFNPRGSTVVSVTMNDGSKVWLNAESSLKYPVSFNGNPRQVELSGEAYFEVAHNSKNPFRVKISDGTNIEDLGTKFNVNAYPEDKISSTTLLEGAIKVNNLLLKPGEQYQNSYVVKDIDMEEILAWKNGMFQLNGKADIKSIMNQISRWYNVEVVYEGEIDKHFWGSISRSANVLEVLKMLEATGSVHFKIENDKIIVTP